MAIKYISLAIDNVGEKGLGAVATQPISRGELILAEAPILVIPYYESKPHEARQAIVNQLSSLSEHQSNEFSSLSNAFPATTAIEGIVKTNALPLRDGTGSSGVFTIASRFNHSCVASAVCSFHAATRTLRVHAVTTIKPGEEITLSYLPEASPPQSSSSRRSYLLQNFNFLCHCPTCSQPSHLLAVSDMRRDSITRLTKAISSTQLLINQPGHALSYCQQILHLLGEEGERSMLHFDPLFTASRICAAHGDAQRAKAFMALASRVRIACLGKDGSARAEELEMLEEHPERHYLAGISRKWDTVNKAAPGAAGSPVFEVWLWERAGEESLAEDMEMHDGIGVMNAQTSQLCVS